MGMLLHRHFEDEQVIVTEKPVKAKAPSKKKKPSKPKAPAVKAQESSEDTLDSVDEGTDISTEQE